MSEGSKSNLGIFAAIAGVVAVGGAVAAAAAGKSKPRPRLGVPRMLGASRTRVPKKPCGCGR